MKPKPPLRPIFLVGASCAGSAVVFELLSQAEGVCVLNPDVRPELVNLMHSASAASLTDAAAKSTAVQVRRLVSQNFVDGYGNKAAAGAVCLHGRWAQHRRIPELRAMFAQARFVYVQRDPAEQIACIISRTGETRTQAEARWLVHTAQLCADLKALPRTLWCTISYNDVLADIVSEASSLGRFVGVTWRQEPGRGGILRRHQTHAVRNGAAGVHLSAAAQSVALQATRLLRAHHPMWVDLMTQRVGKKTVARLGRAGKSLVAGRIAAGLYLTTTAAPMQAKAASFVVTTNADLGAGSLREAITLANASTDSNNAITFDNTVSGTIAVGSQMNISNSMDITRSGAAAPLTLDAAHAARILYVMPNNNGGSPHHVTISGLTLINGAANGGGGGCLASVAAELTLDQVQINGCSAKGGHGGGIYFNSDGTSANLFVSNTTVADCNATFGGGIYINNGVGSTTHSFNLSVIGSTAYDGHNGASFGGGIYAVGQGQANFYGLTLSNNAAGNEGGGMAVSTATAHVSSAFITDNAAVTGAGGGIASVQGALSVDLSLISGCSAVLTGGAIYARQGTLAVQESLLTANTASSGAAIALIFGSASLAQTALIGNSATHLGGAVYTYTSASAPSTLELVNCTVTGNTAGRFAGLNIDGTVATVSLSTITANVSTNYYATGAGIYCGNTNTVISNSIVAGNTVGARADAAAADIGIGQNGAVHATFSLLQHANQAVDDGNNIFNEDPGLRAVAHVSNILDVQIPLSTSPVVDAGDPSFTPPPAIDARGMPRVVNGRVDMGAIELQLCGTVGEGDRCTPQTDPCTSSICASSGQCDTVTALDASACALSTGSGTCQSGVCIVTMGSTGGSGGGGITGDSAGTSGSSSTGTSGGASTGTSGSDSAGTSAGLSTGTSGGVSTGTSGGGFTGTSGSVSTGTSGGVSTGASGGTSTATSGGGSTGNSGGDASTTGAANGGTSGSTTTAGGGATASTSTTGSASTSKKSGCSGLPADDVATPMAFAGIFGGLLNRWRKRRAVIG